LCDRLFPGWQKDFPAAEFVDRVLAKRLPVPDERWAAVEQGLETAYPYGEIYQRHSKVIGERDDLYRTLQNRKGRVYVVDFKKTGQFVAPASRVRSWRVGLNELYPEGLGAVKFDEVELTGLSGPCETNQLFYVRAVDTEARADRKPYTVEGTRQPDGTWKGAVVATPLFTLKAPRVRIVEAGDLVKVQVLARVKE
jgi:hypothetical protein